MGALEIVLIIVLVLLLFGALGGSRIGLGGSASNILYILLAIVLIVLLVRFIA